MRDTLKFFTRICVLALIFSTMSIAASPHKEDTPAIPDASQQRLFTDSYGRTLSVPARPSRIVSLGPNITEAIYTLGRGDALIARTEYCDYPAAALDLPSIGTLQSPDIEAIIELEPDLVIASTHISQDMLDSFSRAGIPAVGVYADAHYAGVYATISELGSLIDAQHEADSLIFTMGLLVDDTRQRVEGIPTPSVYYAVGFGAWGDYTSGGDTYIHEMITAAGGKNIAEDVSGWSFSRELLIERDPDIIFVSKHFGMYDSFLSDPAYSELSAVKEGRVIAIDNNLIDRQGVRNAYGIRMLAEYLHPEKF